VYAFPFHSDSWWTAVASDWTLYGDRAYGDRSNINRTLFSVAEIPA